jgi:alkylated DNA repair protein alkB family protein 8
VETHSSFSDAIASLSLGGPAAMAFRRGGAARALALPPRSLVVLEGEARLVWEHGIPARKSDPLAGGGEARRAPRRVSLTFRRARRGAPCSCAFPEACDDQTGALPPTRLALQAAAAAGAEFSARSEASAAAVEAAHVWRTYEAIAPHFSATRVAVWPAARAFLAALPRGALVVDAGCGNGKYFGVRADVFVAGADRSAGLAAAAARRLRSNYAPAGAGGGPAALPRADVAVADALRLPFRAGAADGVLCVAVLHHLASTARRAALVAELARVLRPGGRALVTAWAREQSDPRKLAKWAPIPAAEGGGRGDFMVPWHLPLHRAEAAAAAPRAEGVDAGRDALLFRRFYHLFEAGELAALAGAAAPGCAVVEARFESDNWVVVLEKH